MYFGSNTHTTQEESAESGRSDFTGAIFYFHRYKRSYVVGVPEVVRVTELVGVPEAVGGD